jgi:hypothetical protein
MNRRAIIVVCLLAILLGIVVVYLISSSPSSTVLLVEPNSVQETAEQNFAVNVSISNVVDLYGWQLTLSWNSSLLNVISVVEGPMLRSSGNSTFFSPKVNGASGNLSALCTRLQSLGSKVTGVSGDGTLMIIQFKVIASGSCDLSLHDTQLLNSGKRTISHTVQDGHFST